MESSGEHMLKKAADEFFSGNGHGFPDGLAGIFVAEGHTPIVDRENAVIGNGDAMNIPGQVLKNRAGSLDSGFTMDHPGNPPDGFRQFELRKSLAKKVSKHSPKDNRKSLHRDQITLAGMNPSGWLFGNPSGRNQAMNVGMINQGSGPSVKNG